MRYSINSLFIAVSLLAAQKRISAETQLSVNQYGGPTECEENEKVVLGKYITIHFNGTVDESSATGEKGFLFHSTRLSSTGGVMPFRFGKGDVIEGWEEGLKSMCKGAKVELIVPPEKAFGDEGFMAGTPGEDDETRIPGGATLKYDIEIMDVSDEDPHGDGNLFAKLDTNGDGKLDATEVETFFKVSDMEVPDDLWETEDKDKDGFISWDEFTGPKGEEQTEEQAKATEDQLETVNYIFDQLDENSDGKLSRDEFTANTGEISDETWAGEDKDGDGFLSREEFVGQFSAQKPVQIGKDEL